MSCVLTMLMRLRQLTCHPWLLRRNPGDPAHPDDFEVSEEDLMVSMNMPVVNAGADFISAVTQLGDAWVTDVAAKLKARYDANVDMPPGAEDEAGDNDCGICMDAFDAETITECKHSFCRECIGEVFKSPPGDGGDLTDEQSARGARKCPLCRSVIEQTKLFSSLAFFEPEKQDGVKAEDGGSGSDSGPSSDRKGKRKAVSHLRI
jgi:hypothetical protein